MKRSKDNCTATIIGKKAAIGGSATIVRGEDGYGDINEKLFVVHETKDYDEDHVSKYNGLKLHLKGHGCKRTVTPTANIPKGRWGEQGINEYNVVISATETEAADARCLGHDPLAKSGVDKDFMVYFVLLFVKNTCEGMEHLGKLIEKYGTGESSGVTFSDHNEVWYFETGAGRQWVAQRIPKDSYVICPNTVVIQGIGSNDHENFMYVSTIHDFTEKNRLNPSTNGKWSFRNIFGIKTEADSYYDTPRTRYGQKLFNPSVEQSPLSQEMPLIRKSEKKTGVEDIEYFLPDHYNGAEYDPMGSSTSGDDKKQKIFKSIALDRNQSGCILQVRNNVPREIAGIQWINFGFYAYSPYVSFYTNIGNMPLNYQKVSHMVTPESSAHWLYKSLQVLVEPRYH